MPTSEKSSRSTLTPELVKALDSLGFEWQRATRLNADELLEGLTQFRKLHGHLRVVRNFVVPSTPNWPSSMWGLKLGWRVAHIRSRGDFFDDSFRQKLDEIDFEWVTTRFTKDQELSFILQNLIQTTPSAKRKYK